MFKRTGSIHVEYQCRYNFCWSSSESYDCHILLKWRKNIKRGLSYRRIYCFMDYSVVCHKALSYLTWSSIHYLLLVKFCTSSKCETTYIKMYLRLSRMTCNYKKNEYSKIDYNGNTVASIIRFRPRLTLYQMDQAYCKYN